MLKAHQACIDLGKNVLRIQTREVSFLSEHELPEQARIMDEEPSSTTTPSSVPASQGQASSSAQPPTTPFPGGGRTLGTAPAGGDGAAARPGGRSAAAPASNRHSEESISTIMGLGVTREVAISTLDAAEGNLDAAASLLF